MCLAEAAEMVMRGPDGGALPDRLPRLRVFAAAASNHLGMAPPADPNTASFSVPQSWNPIAHVLPRGLRLVRVSEKGCRGGEPLERAEGDRGPLLTELNRARHP